MTITYVSWEALQSHDLVLFCPICSSNCLHALNKDGFQKYALVDNQIFSGSWSIHVKFNKFRIYQNSKKSKYGFKMFKFVKGVSWCQKDGLTRILSLFACLQPAVIHGIDGYSHVREEPFTLQRTKS